MKCLYCNNSIESSDIHGLHEDCFDKSFGAKHTEFYSLDPQKTVSKPSSSDIEKKRDTFFHGKYLKYSAMLGQIYYILKIQEPEYPDLPIVEYLCNQIAETLGIDVPPHHLINYKGRITFVTRNFMQDYIGTLIHIYSYLPKGDDNYNCEELIKAILAQTARLNEVSKFIGICLFDTLIGNNDRHGRNLGIIDTGTTKKLSPMYDNPSFIGIQDDFLLESDTNPSGCIWTKSSRYPKPKEYIDEFQRLGYESIVEEFRYKIIAKSTDIISLVEKIDLGQKRKNSFLKLIKKRIKDFEDAK
jgi:hypothetical protein